VRATGLPVLSTCANAASSSGVIVLVEYVWKSGSYCRHVSIGSLSSSPPTKKSSSLGLRTTWIDEVCQRECREDERREANDPNRPRC